MIHFELPFAYSIKWGSASFSCMCISNSSHTISWKGCSFPIKLSCHLCWKSVNYKCEGLFQVSNSISLIYLSIIMLIPHCSFALSFEIRKYESFSFVLPFQYCIWYSESFDFPCECSDKFVGLCKEDSLGFKGEWIKIIDEFWGYS